MKKFKKPASLILALCLVFALAVSACADNNITASGGSGTTPVSLSSTTDGSSGGDPAGTAMNVTVPTSLPMTMSQDGDVLTADNCRITNNSYGACWRGLPISDELCSWSTSRLPVLPVV